MAKENLIFFIGGKMNTKNKVLAISLILLITLLLASACGAISLNLTLDANGGEFDGGSSTYVIKTDGVSTVTLENPTKEGYSFKGWFLDKDVWNMPFTANSLVDAPIQNDMTVYAKWEINQYTISFNSNGGSDITAITQDYNTVVVAPAVPTKIENVFDGWYNDLELTTIFAFTTMPSEDITLYAKWSTIQYTISFNTNGGTEIDPIVLDYGTVVIEPTAPTKTGFEFAGWYRDIELTNYYTFSTMPEENITLYSDWGTSGLTYLIINGESEYAVNHSTILSDSIVIPKRNNGKLVTRINPMAFGFLGTNVFKSVIIPSSVTSIGKWAFFNCASLTDITIGNNVTSIDEEAFAYCTSLISIIIPNNLISIGDSAFSGCNSLTSIAISSSVTSIGDYAFSSCISLTDIIVEISNTSYKSIDGVLFNNAGTIMLQYPLGNARTNYTIPTNVTIIGNFAFAYSPNLISVVIPNSVTTIGMQSFSNCHNLASITIPFSVTSIGDYAFHTCANLTRVNMNRTSIAGITTCGQNIFNYSDERLTIYVPDDESATAYKASYNWIGYSDKIYSQSRVDVEGFVVQNNVLLKYLGTENELTIPSGVTSIDSSAFNGCISLESITIPTSVTTIGNSAFYGCTSLSNITIPASVITIGDSAFSGCTSLITINIPTSITSIGSSAFNGCSSLTSINIPNSVKSIGMDAFLDTGIYNNTSEGSVVYADKWAVDVKGTITNVTLLNDTLHISNGAFFYSYDLSSITIPSSLISIGGGAFYQCFILTNITLGSNLTSIGRYAFSDCFDLLSVYIEKPSSEGIISGAQYMFEDSPATIYLPDEASVTAYKEAQYWSEYSSQIRIKSIIDENGFETVNGVLVQYLGTATSITIPSRVTSISQDVFSDCESLVSVTMGSSVTSIGGSAFNGCTSLANITIGNGVTSIGQWAFVNCVSLTSVIIPASVTSIEESAFAYCQNLTIITFSSSSISIGPQAFQGCIGLETINIERPSTEGIINGGSIMFSNCPPTLKIYLPDEASATAYKAAPYWSDYSTQICAIT